MDNQDKTPEAETTFDSRQCARQVVKGACMVLMAIVVIGWLTDHRDDIEAIGSIVSNLWREHFHKSTVAFWGFWAVAFACAAGMLWAGCCIDKEEKSVHYRNLWLCCVGWALMSFLCSSTFDSLDSLSAYDVIAYLTLFLPLLWFAYLAFVVITANH
jgi:hypothetical protein